METTTDSKSTLTLSDRTLCQLKKHYNCHPWQCSFASDKQGSAQKSSTSFVIGLNSQVKRNQIQTIRWVWQESPARFTKVFHSLQTGMASGIILLQKKCLLLWPDLFRVPRDSKHHFTHLGLYLEPFLLMGIHITTTWTSVLTPSHRDDIMSHYWWWCDPGNHHLQENSWDFLESSTYTSWYSNVLYSSINSFAHKNWSRHSFWRVTAVVCLSYHCNASLTTSLC